MSQDFSLNSRSGCSEFIHGFEWVVDWFRFVCEYAREAERCVFFTASAEDLDRAIKRKCFYSNWNILWMDISESASLISMIQRPPDMDLVLLSLSVYWRHGPTLTEGSGCVWTATSSLVMQIDSLWQGVSAASWMLHSGSDGSVAAAVVCDICWCNGGWWRGRWLA